MATTNDSSGSLDHVDDVAQFGFGTRLPGGRHGLSRATVETSQRERLMGAMISATVELGYAKVTVDEVARRARTAKRTFYTMFDDKEGCLLATYDAVMERLFAEVSASIDELSDPRERIKVGVATTVKHFLASPTAGRFALVECIGASQLVALHRAQIVKTFANALTEWQEQSRRSGARLAPVPPNTAIATVGAIIEPITMALVEESEVDSDVMVNELCELVNAMLFRTHR